MNFRDVELLSAYLDGQLSPSEASRLEARLSTDQGLKATLDELRGTRALLRKLPQRRAPRNFHLTPKMAGIRPPQPRAYPAFRFATALAALLFVAAVGLNAFVPFAASRMAPAAAPAYGIGGGGGGGPIGGGAATEAPLQAPQAALAPTGTAESTMSIMEATAAPQAEDTARAQATEAAANKTAPGFGMGGGGPAESQPLTAQRPTVQQPVPLMFIIALGVVMLLCGGAAWLLRTNSDRRIRSQWNHK
jgi:anti-sigma factor RsiW